MKNKVIILLLTGLVFLITGFYEVKGQTSDKWNGRATWIKTSKSQGKRLWTNNGKEEKYRWDFFFEFRVNVLFVKGKGMVNRIDITENWEKDSLVFSHPDDKYLIEEKTRTIFCRGNELSSLEVLFDDKRKNYWISFFTPTCREHLDFLKLSNIFPAIADASVNDREGIQINLPANFTGHPVGNNTKVLAGSWQEIIPAPNDPGGGEIITRATWDLKLICPPWKNQMTEKNIATLDSRVRAAATRFIQRVNDELCIKLKVTAALRTIAEQDALYAQGRTRPGPIVTNARGGQSKHNSGAAIDAYIVLEDGSIDIGGELPPEVVKIGKEEGFEWGGDWKGKLKDGPHFEMKLR